MMRKESMRALILIAIAVLVMPATGVAQVEKRVLIRRLASPWGHCLNGPVRRLALQCRRRRPVAQRPGHLATKCQGKPFRRGPDPSQKAGHVTRGRTGRMTLVIDDRSLACRILRSDCRCRRSDCSHTSSGTGAHDITAAGHTERGTDGRWFTPSLRLSMPTRKRRSAAWCRRTNSGDRKIGSRRPTTHSAGVRGRLLRRHG